MDFLIILGTIVAVVVVALALNSWEYKRDPEGYMRRSGAPGRRRHEPQPVNHAVHIILVILTAGLWLIPYLIIAVRNPPRRATR